MRTSMPPLRRPRRPFVTAVLVSVSVTASASVATAAAAPTDPSAASVRPAAESSPAAGPLSEPFTVTLITGDTVTVRETAPGRYVPSVRPGPGRAGTGMRYLQVGDRLEVIPADAEPLIASRRVDRRLFDVLAQRRLGYGDAERADIPLLVTGARPSATATGPGWRLPVATVRSGSLFDERARTPQLRPAARLALAIPQVAAASWRADKRTAGRFWTATKAAALDPARSGERLWLVGQRRVALQDSARQVGAPAAWKAGFTGRGVRVAVLDTGYDATHPDLRGVVKQARDFTGSRAGTKDLIGHGTHVASIVAGRGTASRGRHTGVAKGADLVVGKVCPDENCADDAILAGMVWSATTARARVVNLSLGDTVRDGPDLLVQAVEALTTTTGALFVVSAGNDGPREGTVASPSNAPSALAVASVGRTDRVSPFSSRGPWVVPSGTAGYGLKPDLSAPGEKIVAARSATARGMPAAPGHGGRYAAASGTSMAAPHVAGAAAVLAQRHPTWRAAQLKAALMSSAAPVAGDHRSPYAQGAGRLDLGRAVTSPVTASTGSLDFGLAAWPNTDAAAVTRTITYRNTGRTPLVLNLSTQFAGTDQAALRTVFSLDADRVTVPAADATGPGTATVTATHRPGAGPFGARSGHLTATTRDGAVRVRTTLGGYREPESYDLTVTALDSRGRPAAVADVAVVDPARDGWVEVTPDGTSRIRVPATGRTLHAAVHEPTPGSEAGRNTLAVQELRLTRDTALVIDARRGRRVTVAMDRSDVAARLPATFDYMQARAGLPVHGGAWVDAAGLYLLPSGGPVPGLQARMRVDFVKKGRGPSPFVYHAAPTMDGGFPDDPTLRVAAADFAAIRNTYARQNDREQLATTIHTSVDTNSAVFERLPLGNLPARTHFVTGDAGWAPILVSTAGAADAVLEARPLERRFTPGQAYTERWNTAVFGAAFHPSREWQVVRTRGGTVTGPLWLYSDADGHLGQAPGRDTGRVRVLHGRSVLSSEDGARHVRAGVGTRRGTLRIEAGTRRPSTGPATLSTSQSYAWTVSSSPVTTATPAVLPLLAVRYTPTLDGLNRAPRNRSFTIPTRVDRAPGSPAASIRSLTVHSSLDGGRTWQPAVVRRGNAGRWTTTVRHPDRAAAVSLRAVAVDSRGNRVDQTTIDAYRLR